MRLMDAELGGGGRVPEGGGSVGGGSQVGGTAPPPLPLPDASALDWATLVHTATRAMLQVIILTTMRVNSYC